MKKQLGPYRLLERLGSGAMGEVFLAVGELEEHKVAVKVLSKAAAEETQTVARFLQEARILATLKHPGIVRILGGDKLSDGEVYLAMEYLQGVTLRSWLPDSGSAATLQTSLAIASQVADAMAEVHACGIVHRDLKPENILLLDDEAQVCGYRAKVIDFGIAKAPPTADGSVVNTRIDTRTPLLLGTAAYIAPEQCRNPTEVDDRADVYALGVILFEMLARRPPFTADSAVEIITLHVQEKPPHLLDFVPTAPPLLGALIDAMLAKDPVRRPNMRRVCERLTGPWQEEDSERPICPLPGLRSFTEDHAEMFFGRDEALRQLTGMLERLHSGQSRWLAIEGASGTGKTSLVQAGLLPMMRGQDRASGSRRWRIACMRPGDDPIRNLARALVDVESPPGQPLHRTDELVARLRATPESLLEFATNLPNPDGVLLIIIEQMEDLFAVDERVRADFDAFISRALSAQQSPIRLLTTLRSDFLPRLPRLPQLSLCFGQALRFSLSNIEEQDLNAIANGLTRSVGLQLADGLAEKIARDASESNSPLPLLGHTLTRTSRNHTGFQGLCPWTPPGTRPRTPRSYAPNLFGYGNRTM